ncbi:succinylglutamate desuccinylase/aspartoacylase family protein (plasmid) [Peteryoungia desertarenae]|uniref:Succinylglutamate desuccinylase/aspartoacylase family protein n=1 Tax=Peteryoungia desertarenae TaxID=1813451 RepID=A0ABX6QT17_9HYPH|nr:succinylglutamate desuccinylase/aspartoacylase family protein [Peteryoungia desertarenae]QLF71577.1 succinylglutamate desuccinylase/aspartoacylase family protein [Peteryoungia desertarenae]
MHEHFIDIPGRATGTIHRLTWFSFGDGNDGPHVYVQGGLHADEGPGMLVARLLVDRLIEEDRAGKIRGRVTVVPAANPLALGQFLHGDQQGRFDHYDGRNFNRDYPDLTAQAIAQLKDALTKDPQSNTARIRQALLQALETIAPSAPSDRLRHALMRLALPADVVIDLHCDGEAELHLYTQPASLESILPLAALARCRAVLVADVSGGEPFDEALTRPWGAIAEAFPDKPVSQGCVSCTLELRGRMDVDRKVAGADAKSLVDYLRHIGVIAGKPILPALSCEATPLAGSEALVAPVSGLVSYTVSLGHHVRQGEVVAEITDPVTGDLHPVAAGTSGVFYARPATRIAEINKRLGKIAGTRPFRSGPLLSP